MPVTEDRNDDTPRRPRITGDQNDPPGVRVCQRAPRMRDGHGDRRANGSTGSGQASTCAGGGPGCASSGETATGDRRAGRTVGRAAPRTIEEPVEAPGREGDCARLEKSQNWPGLVLRPRLATGKFEKAALPVFSHQRSPLGRNELTLHTLAGPAGQRKPPCELECDGWTGGSRVLAGLLLLPRVFGLSIFPAGSPSLVGRRLPGSL